MSNQPLPPVPDTLPSQLFKAGARLKVQAGYRPRRARFSRRRTALPGTLRSNRQEVLEEEQPGVLYGHPKGEAHLWVWL